MWEKKSLGQAGTARKGDMVPMTREEEADGKGLGEVCGWDSCATCFLQGLGAEGVQTFSDLGTFIEIYQSNIPIIQML